MNLPSLYNVTNSRSSITTFGGLNETYSCGEAEFSEMMNFSARGYPTLRVREPRAKGTEIENFNGMYHLNGMMYVSGKDISYISDDGVMCECRNAVADSKKTMVGMGTKVLIWPDKVMYDTTSNSIEKLATKWSIGNLTVTVQPCDYSGRTYTVNSYGKTEPTNPSDGTVFLRVADASKPWDAASALEVYSADRAAWDTVTLNYCLITADGIGRDLAEGDGITISNCGAGGMGMYASLEGDYIVYAVDDNSIRITGGEGGERFYGKAEVYSDGAYWTSADGGTTQLFGGDWPMMVERRVPDLSYMTENANRIWGCGKRDNVIYACKQGDPKNWYCYNGIASDSYAVTVGSEGSFTGAATCQGYTLFFKENCIHKIYGDRPATYQVVSTKCRGVANGAAESLRVLEEVLFYASTEGVMAWDGSLPVKMSAKLDDNLFATLKTAQGGTLNTRYYLHVTTSDKKQRLLCYDTERGTWHEEDTGESTGDWAMCSTGRQLYHWMGGKTIWATEADREGASKENTEATAEFSATTGDIGTGTPADKYISRITVRADAEERSMLHVQASYDGGAWTELGRAAVLEKYERVNLPFAPTRCDTLRLRFSGTGRMAIRSISLTLAASEGARVQGAGPRK